jgi:hypothetical protein
VRGAAPPADASKGAPPAPIPNPDDSLESADPLSRRR